MDEQNQDRRTPDPKRLEALRRLPKNIMEALTKEDVNAILHEDVWPDTLREILKDYLVDED